MPQSEDLTEKIRRLCAGADPLRLGIPKMSDGFLDLRVAQLRGARTVGRVPISSKGFDLGSAEVRRDKLVVYSCGLNMADLSKSSIDESIWENVHFRDIRFIRVKARNVVFGSGEMERVSFTGADLRRSHWGTRGVDGPTVTDADFSGADLRGSTFGHPLFKRCRFVDTNLKDVDFRGSRFEECKFEGVLDGVWFHGLYGDNGSPQTAGLKNTMNLVDFTHAELRWVDFTDGIDLRTCKFPDRGYVMVANPRSVLQSVGDKIRKDWKGSDREIALRYISLLLRDHFREEQPVWLVRREDLTGPPLGERIGGGIVSLLVEISDSSK